MQNTQKTAQHAKSSTPVSEPYEKHHYSGLATLLANPAHLAHAQHVWIYGGTLDSKIASHLQSCAQVASNSLGVITTAFGKLILSNTELENDELLYALHELTTLTGELMPILTHIAASIAEIPTHSTKS